MSRKMELKKVESIKISSTNKRETLGTQESSTSKIGGARGVLLQK